MRPRIFLSHSKKDKMIVEKLAVDLRIGRIDCWYDDWEIPSGASLRTKIFEEGIKDCDLFFAFLSATAVTSEWCRRELDAAFVREFEQRGGFLALFVDHDETRNSLSLDLQALRIPSLNDQTYSGALLQITALAWEAYAKRQMRREAESNRLTVAELERKIAEKDLAMLQLQLAGAIDVDMIAKNLSTKTISHAGKSMTLKEVFIALAIDLAIGVTDYRAASRILTLFEISNEEVFKRTGSRLSLTPNETLQGVMGKTIADFLGPLTILGLVEIKPETESKSERFFLTAAGKDIARQFQ